MIMDFKVSLEMLQGIVTELTEGALVHKMQGQIFKSQGFVKLGQKYIDHYSEEMGWVEKCVDRMLDLGCTPQVKAAYDRKLHDDAVEYINADLEIQRRGVETLYKALPMLACDPTTYDIVKAYLADEEEDLYWSEEQLDLIEKIGLQNWLTKQI